LPELWQQAVLSQPQKKALLRCLIDKVVLQRTARDRVRTRIVWKGGATTTQELAVPVGALADLSNGAELERLALEWTATGMTDEAAAQRLTEQGFRSPRGPVVLPSTVKILRLRQGVMRQRSQSHPRSVPGSWTVSQLARTLGVSPHWLYDRIHNGTIPVAKDPATGLYLFPATPATLEQLTQLKLEAQAFPGS
jgi:hypothetical protein